MKKILFLFLFFSFAWLAKSAQVGDWNLYLAYHNAVLTQSAGEEVYACFDGNLMAYRPKDDEIRLLSKLNGLSGLEVKAMGYSETEECLVLVDEQLQVDLMYPKNGEVISLPQIKDSGKDGLIGRQLFVSGEYAVIALNHGLVVLNLHKREVVGYYDLGRDIQAAAIFQGMLYAAAEGQLLACEVAGNPLDLNEWKVVENVSFSQFAQNGEYLYGVAHKRGEALSPGLWLLSSGQKKFQRVTDRIFTQISAQYGKLLAVNAKDLQIYGLKTPDVAEIAIAFDNTWSHVSRSSDGVLWASEGMKGVQAYKISGNKLTASGEPIGQYGPRRDLCYYMQYYGNRLLIAGGRLDPTDRQHYPGTIMELTDGKWKFYQDTGITEQTSLRYRDITCVAVDPKNENRLYASAGGTGLYVFENYNFVKHISRHNSPLESAAGDSPNYVRIDGLNFDADGNLWMVNNAQKDTVLRVMRPDGTWKGLYIEPIQKAPTCEKTLIDRKGRLWMASRRTVDNPRHDAGLLCLDYNGTLDNTKDDVVTYRSTFVNQDGKSYLLGGVYCMAEDRDGSIWVGTASGLFVVSRPDEWFDPDYRVTQVKVPRNDGTNLADYLLSDMPISAIAIDGAGRKWIGTQMNGLYLVSADGTQILAHFEAKDTPLLSNLIYSLAVNEKTGEVMIGTDKGLCSYQSQATGPMPSLNESNIKVYPNPVRPEYHGDIRVTGLTDNAEVKVMTTHGEVVAVGRSVGGTFVWNVRGGDGARVAPGIYYFMIATADGEDGIAAKILVI